MPLIPEPRPELNQLWIRFKTRRQNHSDYLKIGLYNLYCQHAQIANPCACSPDHPNILFETVPKESAAERVQQGRKNRAKCSSFHSQLSIKNHKEQKVSNKHVAQSFPMPDHI
jgi:hypothetical protein